MQYRYLGLQKMVMHHPTRKMFVLIALAVTLPAMSAAVQLQQPNPSLSPADVVRIQLQAMQHNDQPAPDAGIATAYGFASPGNHGETGSLSHFRDVIHAEYQPMIDSRKIILGATRVEDGHALQPVNVIASDGLAYSYLFILSRQHDAPYRNCWMTDSVLQQDSGRGQGLAL